MVENFTCLSGSGNSRLPALKGFDYTADDKTWKIFR